MTQENAGRVRPPAAELLRRIEQLAADLSRSRTLPPTLAVACRAAVDMERRKLALFAGPGHIADDAGRDAALARLDRRQRPFLEVAATLVPSSWSEHVLRALICQLVDAGALYAAARLGSPSDRLLAAVVHDLAAS